MKVLLINLQSNLRFPSLGCAYILSHLKQNGVQVDFYDLVSAGIRLEHKGQRKESRLDSSIKFAKAIISTSKIVRPIKKGLKRVKTIYDSKKSDTISNEVISSIIPTINANGYDFILISTAQRYNECANIAAAMRKESDIPLIIGGPQFTIDEISKRWLDHRAIECIAAFEAERYLYDFLRGHKNGDFSATKGIWYKKNGATAFTGKADIIRDIDTVPMPSFREYDLTKYRFGVLPILTSRGCAWGRCTFCSDPCVTTNMHAFRTRAPESIVAELKNDIDSYGIDKFIFLDEEVNGDIDWWRKVLEHIIKSGIDIRFVGAFQSTKQITKEILKLSYDAGYRVIAPGIESGSDRMLKLMKKGTTVKMNEALIQNANDAGINVRCAIMYGFPGESLADLKDTISFLTRNKAIIRKIWLSKFSITVGSPIYNDLDRHKKEGLVRDLEYDYIKGQVYFTNPILADKEYVKHFYELQNLASEINQKGYTDNAKDFDQIL